MQEYNNEDVMVGSWLLGLNVEHTFDSAFCCGDMSVCHSTDTALAGTHRLTGGDSEGAVATRDCNAYAPGAAAGLAPMVVPESGKVCAMFGGGCNGVCGVEDNEAEFAKHSGCARVV